MPHLAVLLTVLLASTVLDPTLGDCVLELATRVRVTEGQYLCEPIKPWLRETEADYGRRFMRCMNSEFQYFQCFENLRFDITAIACFNSSAKCFAPPAPQVTAQPTTTPPQRNPSTTSGPTTTPPQRSPVSPWVPTPATIIAQLETIPPPSPTPSPTLFFTPTTPFAPPPPPPPPEQLSPRPQTLVQFPQPTPQVFFPSLPQPTPQAQLPSLPQPTPQLPFPLSPQPTPQAPLPSPPQPTPQAPLPSSPQPTPQAPLPSPPQPTPQAPLPSPPQPTPQAPLPSPPQPTPQAPLPSSPQPTPQTPLPSPPQPTPQAPLPSPSQPTPQAPLPSAPQPTTPAPYLVPTPKNPPPRATGPLVAGCNTSTCSLPNCFCMGAEPTIDLQTTPMMVMVSFDDAVTNAFSKDFYSKLFIDNVYNILNPNNCSIKATFFLSTENTDFKVVKQLYEKGNEFASHTIHHILPDGGTKQQFEDEIVGVRDLLYTFSQIEPSHVVGFRAPYLKLMGNKMYQVLSESKFRYDASISNIERWKGGPHLWPFTMDFPIPPDRCPNGPCPTEKFPGLWAIPLNSWKTTDGSSYCSMIDACVVADPADDVATTKEKYLQYFRKNFYEDFYPRKVPIEVFTHSALFLRNPGSFDALKDFLLEINKLKNVWILTPSQVIDWMQRPVSNNDVTNGAISSWNCGSADA